MKMNLPPGVNRKGKRCPACGTHTYRQWGEGTWICSTCGATKLTYTDGTTQSFGFVENDR